MSRRASPFSAKAVLLLLLVGTIAFLVFLYALGRGWTGGEEGRNGGNHAAANGINGFSGLVQLLQATGHDVSLSRNPADRGEYGLLILTPPLWSNAEEIHEIIEQRIETAAGPTMLILPKWTAMPVPETDDDDSQPGWVVLGQPSSPQWFGNLSMGEGARLAIGATSGWQGLGSSGDLPDETAVQALVEDSAKTMAPLVLDSEGDVLAARYVRPGAFDDHEPWPVIVVFEPDLVNNYGMADRQRAAMAVQLVNEATQGSRMPIRFDLTLNGLGASQNLLTLAFSPPFLAATLCLLLAALVIGWRAFLRFGPSVAEAPAMAQGKRQLVLNGAALIERVKRWHLLKAPYEDLIARRVASALGLRHADHAHREIAIDQALARRGHRGSTFSHLAADLREAQRPREIIRAARALRTFERTLTQ